MHAKARSQSGVTFIEIVCTHWRTSECLEMANVIHSPRGYVDADGWARHSDGAPISLSDGCGQLSSNVFKHASSSSTSNKSMTSDGILAAVTSKYSYKFFHWLVEALPRIALLLAAEPRLLRASTDASSSKGSSSASARLLVSCKTRLVKETLSLLGVDVSRAVLCWRAGHAYHTTAELLWPQSAPCGGARPFALRALRRVALPPHLRPVRNLAEVYSSGAVLVHHRQGMRRLRNHDELLSALHNTPTLTSPALTVLSGGNGTVTLREQITIFRGARCQVGPHGAGMALMVFAPTPWFGTAEVTPGVSACVDVRCTHIDTTQSHAAPSSSPCNRPGRCSVCASVSCCVRPCARVHGVLLAGAYFVSIRGKPGDHLNRHRNRTSKWIHSPKPNACYKGLSATMGMRHEWIVVGGAPANEDLEPDIDAVVKLALRVCAPPRPADGQIRADMASAAVHGMAAAVDGAKKWAA